MITPAFGLTATERVLPKLALDFTTASLDSRVTFTRTTGASNPATYVNSSGVVTAATNNQPRFDYDPVTLACKGLLIEESRANLVIYSQDFTNAAWTGGTLTNMTLGASSETSPGGTTDAGVLTATDPSCSYQAANSIATTIVGTQTMSMYVKSTNRQWWRIRVYRTSANAATCWFDLQNGVVGNNASVGSLTFSSATIAAAGNGWYRITITVSSSALGTNANFWVAPATSNGGTTGGAIGDAINIWGNQYETGAFATSYIPTTLLSLTRNADVAVMTGTNFSDWYNASEGTFTCQFNQAYSAGSSFPVKLEASDGGTANRILMYATSPSSGETLFVRTLNVTACNIFTSVVSNNTTAKLTGGYKQNNFGVALNGASTQVDTSGNIPVVNRLSLGYSAAQSLYWLNGHLQKVFFYNQKLTSSEIQSFSK